MKSMENRTNRNLNYAVARSRRDNKLAQQNGSWPDFLAVLQAHERRTPETILQYQNMTREQRGDCKDVGGFVGGELRDGSRTKDNVLSRSLLTLYVDHGDQLTPDHCRQLLEGLAGVLYPTHSYTPTQPRYRIVMPLSRKVSPAEYPRLVRSFAARFPQGALDDTDEQPSHLMFWPSYPKDFHFMATEELHGEELDVEKLLQSMPEVAAKALPVPLQLLAPFGLSTVPQAQRPAVVECFCSRWPVPLAISCFLSSVYTPCGGNRYTYVGAETAGGLVVLPNGLAYSHHATDPVHREGRAVNSFDLVRIHLFGSRDGGCESLPMTQRPSFREMQLFVEEHTGFRAGENALNAVPRNGECQNGSGSALLSVAERPSAVAEGPQNQPELSERDKLARELYPAVSKMKMTRSGGVLSSAANIEVALEYDPHLKGAFAFEEFTRSFIKLRPMPWDHKDDSTEWRDRDNSELRVYLEKRYELCSPQKISDVFNTVANKHRVNALQERVKALQWDGTERDATFFCKTMGADDTELVHMETLCFFIGAMKRLFEPGCKHDSVLTLVGPEGIGKSTVFRKLALGFFSDTFQLTNDPRKNGEQLAGRWMIEVAELAGLSGRTSQETKAYLTSAEDKYRPAYARQSDSFKRSCIFVATTNKDLCLKGDDGNRRFHIMECHPENITLNAAELDDDTVSQVLAEAYRRYKNGEHNWLDDRMKREAKKLQSSHNENVLEVMPSLLEDFLNVPIPKEPYWDRMSKFDRRIYMQSQHGTQGGSYSPDQLRRRDRISMPELFNEFLGQEYLGTKSHQLSVQLGQALGQIGGWKQETYIRKNLEYMSARNYVRIASLAPAAPQTEQTELPEKVG